jgi:hypothetical protein
MYDATVMNQVNRILDRMDDARERRTTKQMSAKDKAFMVASPTVIFSREAFGEDDVDLEGYANRDRRDVFLTEDNGAVISNLKGQVLVGALAGDLASGRDSAVHYARNAELALQISTSRSSRKSKNRRRN